jgi:hypothetical protein
MGEGQPVENGGSFSLVTQGGPLDKGNFMRHGQNILLKLAYLKINRMEKWPPFLSTYGGTDLTAFYKDLGAEAGNV